LLSGFGFQGTDTLPMMETLKVLLMPASASFTNPFIWVWEPHQRSESFMPNGLCNYGGGAESFETAAEEYILL